MRRNSQTMNEERRDLSVAVARPEVRKDETTGAERFGGHAAVFNERTAIGNPLTWGFYEQVADGAFTKTIDEGDARFLIDHDSYYVVARKSANTLVLAQDKIGLDTDAALDEELSYVKDLKANLRNGNITGMSFGFYVMKDDWDLETVELSDGTSTDVEVRTIREVRLIEVSAVTFPAYEATDAGLRSAVAALRSRGDVDAIARRAGFRPELATLLDEVRPARSIAPGFDSAAASSAGVEEPASDVGAPVVPVRAAAEDDEDDKPFPPVDAEDENDETKSAGDGDTTEDDRAGEPGETTRDQPDTTDETQDSEPAETTRSLNPSEAARRKAQMSVLAARLGLPLAA